MQLLRQMQQMQQMQQISTRKCVHAVAIHRAALSTSEPLQPLQPLRAAVIGETDAKRAVRQEQELWSAPKDAEFVATSALQAENCPRSDNKLQPQVNFSAFCSFSTFSPVLGVQLPF